MGGGHKWREKTACGQRGRCQLEAVAVSGVVAVARLSAEVGGSPTERAGVK